MFCGAERRVKMLKIKNNKKKTYVTFILDKSGSMASIRLPMIEAFNEQLASHRKNKVGDVYMSLIQFDDNIEETFFNVPIENISGELSTEDYVLGNSTSLCDAIGKTMNKLQKLDVDGDAAHLVIVISDGMENSSTRFNRTQIKNLCNELKETGKWTIQYVGCEESALNEAEKHLNIKTHAFSKNAFGVKDVSGALSTSNTSYYAARAVGLTAVEDYMQNDNSIMNSDLSK